MITCNLTTRASGRTEKIALFSEAISPPNVTDRLLVCQTYLGYAVNRRATNATPSASRLAYLVRRLWCATWLARLDC